MNILKKVVKKGSQIGRDWADSHRELHPSEEQDHSVQAALSNKQLLIDKIGQLLQYYNEKELKAHSDVLRTDEKDSFYSMLLVEQQHYYEGVLGQELKAVRELKAQLLKRLSETDSKRSRSPSRERQESKASGKDGAEEAV